MKKLFFSLLILPVFLIAATNQSFAIDDFLVSNSRMENERLTVDINPSAPDNICSWWQQLHNVYLTDAAGNRVGEFNGCGNNPSGGYTMSGGQAGGYLPDSGTYRVEVYEGEQPPYPYDVLSS